MEAAPPKTGCLAALIATAKQFNSDPSSSDESSDFPLAETNIHFQQMSRALKAHSQQLLTDSARSDL